jgi:aspartyl-tRNA(Asn)/glutamyl-tRNA(Gln) amidotransferase subunit A
MAGSSELWKMDAVALAQAVRTKQVSAVEVTEAALHHIETLDPLLHAFCTPTPEIARAEAAAVERAILAGDPVGPLAGLPYGIKDLICTKGVRTASGSFAYHDFIPEGGLRLA